MMTGTYRLDVPSDLSGHDDDRTRIAVAILTVVAEFTGSDSVLTQLEAGALVLDDDETTALAAERLIRAGADAAESTTNASGHVITAVLDARYLLDDYLRIKEVEQHFAFDDDFTAAEDRATTQLLRDKATKAAERAAWWVEHAKQQAQVCACGHRLSAHNEQGRRSPTGSFTSGCFGFRPATETTLIGLGLDGLQLVWEQFLLDTGHDDRPTAYEEGMRVLRELKTSSPRLLVGEALDVTAGAIALETTAPASA